MQEFRIIEPGFLAYANIFIVSGRSTKGQRKNGADRICISKILTDHFYNHTQISSFGKYTSSSLPVYYGLPQGAILLAFFFHTSKPLFSRTSVIVNTMMTTFSLSAKWLRISQLSAD